MSKPVSPTVPEQVEQVTPDAIMQMGLGLWGSKTLLTGVELGLFAEMSKAGPLEAEGLRERLGLHPRAAGICSTRWSHSGCSIAATTRDTRTLPATKRSSTPKSRATSVECSRWPTSGYTHSRGSRPEALHTGQPQNEAKTDDDFFETVYADPGGWRSSSAR